MPQLRSAAASWAVGVLMVALGATSAYFLLVGVASWEQVYRGYYAPSETLAGREVHWARASYSKVEIHADGSRRIELDVALVAPPSAPEHGMHVVVSINDLPIRRVEVSRAWQVVSIVTPLTATQRPLTIQFDTGPVQSERGIGVGSIEIDAGTVIVPRIARAALGAFAGALLWVITPMARAASMAGWMPALRALVWPGRFGIVALSVLLLLPSKFELLSTAAQLALQLALLVLPGWWVLTFVLRQRVRTLTADHIAVLSMPVTVVLVAVMFVVLQISGAPTFVFTGVVALAYGGIMASVGTDRDRQAALWRFSVDYRHIWLLSLLVPLAALTYVSVGLDDAADLVEWTRVANRGLHQLPNDNNLSWLMSETWRERLDANALFYSIWTIGDRGPLFGVLHSFFSRALEADAAQYVSYIRLGALLNAMYVGPLFLWLHRRCGDARIASAVVVLVALNPWFFLNVYYTWPKMFGAAFVLTALFMLWDEERVSTYHYIAAGGVFGLGILSHAASTLSFPMFYLFTLGIHVRSLPDLRRSLLMPLVIVGMLVPWAVYKQIYSPETFNLVTMHYLDGGRLGGYGEPIMDNLRNFFEAYPLADQLWVRLDQVYHLVWKGVASEQVLRFWTGSASGQLLYTQEFFHPLHSAGILWLALIPLALAVEASRAALRGGQEAVRWWVRSMRDGVNSAGLSSAVVALAFAGLGLSLNAMLQWGMPLTHQLPYGETLLIAAVGAYALRRLGIGYWLLALGAVLTRQVYYFVESARTSVLRLPTLDAHGMHFWGTCAVIILLGFVLSSELRKSEAGEA